MQVRVRVRIRVRVRTHRFTPQRHAARSESAQFQQALRSQSASCGETQHASTFLMHAPCPKGVLSHYANNFMLTSP